MALENVSPSTVRTRKPTKLEQAIAEASEPTENDQAIADARARDAEAFDSPETEPTNISPFKADSDARMAAQEAQAASDAGTDDGTIMVAGYNADGEPDDVPAKRPSAKGKAEPVAARSVPLPGFEGLTMDEQIVNISGAVSLNLTNPADAAVWNALQLGEPVTLFISGFTMKKSFRVAHDSEHEIKAKAANAAVKVYELSTVQPAG